MRCQHVWVAVGLAALTTAACGSVAPGASRTTAVGTVTASSSAAGADPMVVTVGWLLPHLVNPGARAIDLAHARPVPVSTSLSLVPPQRRPILTVDEAVAATEPEHFVSSRLAEGASVQVFVATLVDQNAAAGGSKTVFDFEITGAQCVPSPGTTAPPGVTSTRLACVVSVLVDAETGGPLGIFEAWG